MKTLIAGAGVLLALSACATDPIEERWNSREKYEKCGEVDLGPVESLEAKGDKEVACMRAALKSGTGAELKVTYPTIEGDPIRDYYRITPGGKLEIYTDTSDDPFGGKDWHFVECEAPASLVKLEC